MKLVKFALIAVLCGGMLATTGCNMSKTGKGALIGGGRVFDRINLGYGDFF